MTYSTQLSYNLRKRINTTFTTKKKKIKENISRILITLSYGPFRAIQTIYLYCVHMPCHSKHYRAIYFDLIAVVG